MNEDTIELDQKDLAIDKKIESEVERVENEIDTLSKVTFMDSLLDKQTEIRNMLDVRSNIVIGFNSALIVLLVTYFRDNIDGNPVFWVLLSALILSLFLAIVALKPPHTTTKKGQKESLFYHHHINAMDLDEYRKEIHKALDDERQIYDAYITEVYNITCYSNIPRKRFLYSSLRVLIYGMMLAILIYVFMLIADSPVNLF
ncbi:TPA: hypothetical protein DD449_03865 [Candidatus Berkelbacteria bacterium]|uniref:Pycsar effector protein domain-containing protein n=1 Tax=Berkelbacteria bacterium GW2011_GWE1_39_12 TaxID=1618337 RepID=A0A0G4B3V0_9BACT|nr:MAG: hypothetical protein UT28_C0001G0409 [Berkelbacteria bacterium GW2011_GWE1_39_12]HBO60793.1 hypothetical protein [Candidatus Berkelbacteria bacterium]